MEGEEGRGGRDVRTRRGGGGGRGGRAGERMCGGTRPKRVPSITSTPPLPSSRPASDVPPSAPARRPLTIPHNGRFPAGEREREGEERARARRAAVRVWWMGMHLCRWNLLGPVSERSAETCRGTRARPNQACEQRASSPHSRSEYKVCMYSEKILITV